MLSTDHQRDYREDVRWALNYLLKLESIWTVTDIYKLMRNGILMFHDRQDHFHRCLIRIRNMAIHPALEVLLNSNETAVKFEQILQCCDENKWKFLYDELRKDEVKSLELDKKKSLKLILSELSVDGVGPEEHKSIEQIIERLKKTLEEYKQLNEKERHLMIEKLTGEIRGKCSDEYKQRAECELKNSEISSCLAVTSMALHSTCEGIFPYTTQLVSYCLLVARKNEKKDDC